MALGFLKRGKKDDKTGKDAPAHAGDDGSDSANTDDDAPKEPPRRFNKFVVSGAVAMLVAVVAAIFGAKQFVAEELQRETQGWQIRLGIVGDSRAAAVDAWIDKNFKSIRALSENAALQIYMSELATGGAKPAAGDDQSSILGQLAGTDNSEGGTSGSLENSLNSGADASGGYLRNLLIATAESTGFKAPPPVGEVAANVERIGIAGLGLVDKEGVPIVSTPDMPPMTGKIRTAVSKALEGEPAIIDAFLAASGEPTMGFVLPVFGVQGNEGARGIGAVVGVRILDDDLWSQLKQPGDLMKTAETYLIRRNKGKIEYLSRLADGTQSLKRSLALASPNLVDAAAIKTPGGFETTMIDYLGQPVLAVSREISGAPWILVRKVTRKDALSATENRLNVILGVFIGLIVFITLSILFVWKKAASARATEALHTAQLMLERFQNISKFMNVVTNNQPTEIVAVDINTIYTFANEPAAKAVGITQEDMMGKTMAAVMGPIKAQAFAEINKRVITNFEREQQVQEFGDPTISDPDDEDCFQVIKSDHIPLRGDRDYPPGCLMVLDDITELALERRRSEQRMNELIDTLVSVVDRRDPFSAHHSSRVSEVSCAIAREMGLDDLSVRTLDVAGRLMNFGKIFIPPEVLTKTENLTDEERLMVQHAYLTTVDLIEGVTFEGPVLETVRQMGETWDGRGPLGLKAEEIIVTARVLAIANTFVGMISPRAYRGAMPFRKASDILMEECGTKFDRAPVSALINYLENRGGMRRWAHFREDPNEQDAAE